MIVWRGPATRTKSHILIVWLGGEIDVPHGRKQSSMKTFKRRVLNHGDGAGRQIEALVSHSYAALRNVREVSSVDYGPIHSHFRFDLVAGGAVRPYRTFENDRCRLGALLGCSHRPGRVTGWRRPEWRFLQERRQVEAGCKDVTTLLRGEGIGVYLS